MDHFIVSTKGNNLSIVHLNFIANRFFFISCEIPLRKGTWIYRFTRRNICSVNILMNRLLNNFQLNSLRVPESCRNHARLLKNSPLGYHYKNHHILRSNVWFLDKHNSFDIEMNVSLEMVPQFCAIALKYLIFFHALICQFVFSTLSAHA